MRNRQKFAVVVFGAVTTLSGCSAPNPRIDERALKTSRDSCDVQAFPDQDLSVIVKSATNSRPSTICFMDGEYKSNKETIHIPRSIILRGNLTDPLKVRLKQRIFFYHCGDTHPNGGCTSGARSVTFENTVDLQGCSGWEHQKYRFDSSLFLGTLSIGVAKTCSNDNFSAQITNSIFYGNGSSHVGIRTDSSSMPRGPWLRVFNSAFYDLGMGISAFSDNPPNDFRNNIFVGNKVAVDMLIGETTFSNNYLHRNDRILQYGSGYPSDWERNPIADPMLDVSNFPPRLAAVSPLIDSSIEGYLEYWDDIQPQKTDFFGKIRNKKPDIGPIEYFAD